MNTNFEVIGKVGNSYWLYKSRKNNTYKTWPPKEERSFEVYDDRLQRIKEIPSPFPDSVIKQYLIPQRYSFDQLMFVKASNKTNVVINRFTPDGEEEATHVQLFDIPGEMTLEDVLVTRSPDRTKILILGFVRSTSLNPDMYARVYTRNWELLNETVYKEGYLLQPVVQYERTEHVLESSDASPVKLTNNGEWLMVAPARLRSSFVLCHFKNVDSSFVQVDIK